MLLEPPDEACRIVKRRGIALHPMALLRVGDECALHTVLEQGRVKLPGFFGWRAAIERAANIQRGGLHPLGVYDRAALVVAAAGVAVVIVEKECDEFGDV